MPTGSQSHGAMNALEVRRLMDRWQLTAPLIYRSNDRWVYVPRGFLTDFDSVPRVPGLHALVEGRAIKSAVIHDWLYHKHAGRAYADRVFLDAMQAEGVPRAMRWVIYAGVRIFGWIIYQRRS